MNRIICIGNRYVKADSAGPCVYDELMQIENLPPDVEVIDGGLAGLKLLPFFETSQKVILVDQIEGIDTSEGIAVLKAEEVVPTAESHYDHSAGVGYLLKVLPEISDQDLPEIVIVGIEGDPDRHKIQKAAKLTLGLAI